MRNADELWTEYRVLRGYGLEKMRALATALGHGELLRRVEAAARDSQLTGMDAKCAAIVFSSPPCAIKAAESGPQQAAFVFGRAGE